MQGRAGRTRSPPPQPKQAGRQAGAQAAFVAGRTSGRQWQPSAPTSPGRAQLARHTTLVQLQHVLLLGLLGGGRC